MKKRLTHQTSNGVVATAISELARTKQLLKFAIKKNKPPVDPLGIIQPNQFAATAVKYNLGSITQPETKN